MSAVPTRSAPTVVDEVEVSGVSPPGPRSVLECRGLRRSYGARLAVDDVSFSIPPGGRYGLVGPNGAGKTTTILMVCGLLPPDRGEVLVDGLPIEAGEPAREAIGYVPQELALYEDLTARETLRFFGRMYGLRRAPLRARTDAVLELMDLGDRADDRVETYSGGMKRRLNVAVGLLHEPRLLVLDEPTVGVDAQSRNAILETLLELSVAGTALLYTSHYMDEVERVCDRIGIIDEGRMVAEGTRRELVAQVGDHDRVVIRGLGDLEAFARHARALGGVQQVVVEDDSLELLLDDASATLPAVLAAAGAAAISVTGIDVHEPGLEALFLRLTGKAVRD